jgi:hypothetical protein
VVLAAQEHDRGWWQWECRPTLSDAGGPLDYQNDTFHSTDARLDANCKLVEICDALAQFLCNRHPLDSSRGGGDPRRVFAEIPAPVGPGSPDVHLSLTALDDHRLAIDPYPFDVDPLDLTYVARWLRTGRTNRARRILRISTGPTPSRCTTCCRGRDDTKGSTWSRPRRRHCCPRSRRGGTSTSTASCGCDTASRPGPRSQRWPPASASESCRSFARTTSSSTASASLRWEDASDVVSSSGTTGRPVDIPLHVDEERNRVERVRKTIREVGVTKGSRVLDLFSLNDMFALGPQMWFAIKAEGALAIRCQAPRLKRVLDVVRYLKPEFVVGNPHVLVAMAEEGLESGMWPDRGVLPKAAVFAVAATFDRDLGPAAVVEKVREL